MSISTPSRPWKFLLMMQHAYPAYFSRTYYMVGMVISDPSAWWGVDLFFLRGPLNNATTYFYDATFIGLALKIYSINFTTKGEVSWWLSLVNPITNSSRLNSQMIATEYCYKLLLQIVTKARNRIILGFGEGMEKGKGTTPPVIYF